jgi:hypothetical protein
MGFIFLAYRCILPASKEQEKTVVEEREGGDGRDPTPKNKGELMPAVKYRCWRQNLKVVSLLAKKLKGGSLMNSNAPP